MDPTYRMDTAEDGTPVYVCLVCAAQGSEHHSADMELFTLHMQQRHDGRMAQEGETQEQTGTATPNPGVPQDASEPTAEHGSY
jgi:hypothetical protein